MLRWVLLLALCATCGGAGKQKKVKPGPKPSLARGGCPLSGECRFCGSDDGDAALICPPGWGGSLKWARSYEHALAKMVQR